MHEAYTSANILNLPKALSIESIFSYGDNLFIGTAQGSILHYGVVKRPGQSPDVQLLRSNKNFSRKPVTQISVVPEDEILVTIREGCVSVHDISPAVTNFPFIFKLDASYNCYSFSLSVQRVEDMDGNLKVAIVRLCVVMRRKLMFYYWKDRKFIPLPPTEVILSDTPRSLAWWEKSICMGTKSEYSLYKEDRNSGEQNTKDLFPTGRNQEPRVTQLQDGRFALDKDTQTTFLSPKGELNLKAVHWSEAPVSMVHDNPYLLSVINKSVEIRTEDNMLIQTLELPKPRYASVGGQGQVYIASNNLVWSLSMVPVSEQVPQLLKDKLYDLAVTLATICDEDGKEKRIQHIKTLMAFDKFCNHKFKESMDIFEELSICPSHVIGLFKTLLPPEFQAKLRYPDDLPELQGTSLKNGLEELIRFLLTAKKKIQNVSDSEGLSPVPIVEGVTVISKRKIILEIIDTTLLKCYLETNDALVASLLRLETNCVNIPEAERVLKKTQRLKELVILYNTKGKHRKALELLREHSEEKDSPLYGHTETIKYLQKLGPEHIDLILEFSLWVIVDNPLDGITIFTDDMEQVELLPRDKVLDWLMKNSPQMVLFYLEMVVNDWKDQNSVFHNNLILQYKDILLDSNTAETHKRLTEKSLLKLLNGEGLGSALGIHYKAEDLLPKFPLDTLHRERAILLARAGRHREALIIYLMILGDLDLAKAHCAAEKEARKERSHHELLVLLIQPPDASDLQVPASSNIQLPDLESALTILNDHWMDVDIIQIIKILPDSAKIHRLEACLISALQAQVAARHRLQLVQNLQRSQTLQLQEQRVTAESVKVEVGFDAKCAKCGKKLSGQIMRTLDGNLYHFACYQE